VGVERKRIAVVPAAIGALLILAAFVVYHFSGDVVSALWFVPLALVFAVGGIVIGVQARSIPASVLGIVVAGLSAWLIVGFVLFVLTCANVVHVGQC
jgi:hypothetical protein